MKNFEYGNPLKDEINIKCMDIIASTVANKILKIDNFVKEAKLHKAWAVFEEGNSLLNSWKNELALLKPRRMWYVCECYCLFDRVEPVEALVVVFERKFNNFINKWNIN